MFKKKHLLLIILVMFVFFTAACNTNTNKNQPKSQPTPSSQGKASTEKSYIFTANESGSISKIDAETNQVISTLSVDGAVHNVQVSPDGKILGATVIPRMETEMKNASSDHKINGYAIFYDTETDEFINKVEVGSHPAHIVFTEDGEYALVTNNEDNTVSVIDANSYEIVRTIPTGNGPHGFRISKDNKFAYVANMKEDTVSVLDLFNFKEVRKIKVGKAPVTTGITRDGNTLVVSVNSEDSVAIVDLATDKVEKLSVGKGPAQVYIQDYDKYAFVANQGSEKEPSASVSKIDLGTKQVLATIATGKGAHGVTTSSDNKYVYVTNVYDDTVTVIDNSTNTGIATIPVDKSPNGITYKP